MTSRRPGPMELLRRYGIHPNRSLGQNFLIDLGALQMIIQIANIEAKDTVLEIGAGLGNLTYLLAETAQRVVAVELDARFIPILSETLKDFSNVEVVQGDILALEPGTLVRQPNYLVVANIPYYITSNLMRHLLEADPKPRRMTLTVQREVAERICARPGDMSLLALSVQVYGIPTIQQIIPAGAFYPPPKVDSATVHIEISPDPYVPTTDLDMFFKLAKAGFSQKRKTLRNALTAGLGIPPAEVQIYLEDAGIDPQRRAETLSIQDWQRLVLAYPRFENLKG